MKTYYYNNIVILCSLILVCNAFKQSASLSRSVNQDSHVSKSVNQDSHVLKSVDQDNHFLNGPRRLISGFIAESLKVYAPVSTTVGNDLCRNHSLWFKDGVINNKMWALKMLDASSKLPSGLLTGNVVELGNYDECLSVEDVESEFGSFSGQHCTVVIGQISLANEIDLLKKKSLGFSLQMFTEEDIKAEGVEGLLLSKMSMLWSVCVPSSCGPSDVEQHLRSVLRTRLGNVSITVQDGACNTRANRKPLRTIDWCCVGFLVCLGVLVVLSSIYDLMTRPSSSRRELLLAFSLPFHWGGLLRVDRPSVDALPVVNGVKAISMLMVFILHVSMFVAAYPAINQTLLIQIMTIAGWMSSFISNGSLAVDSFLLVSGLLTCFNFLKDRENGVDFSLPHFYFHRYIRITPLYAVLQLLSTTLYTHDGVLDGPFWGQNCRVIRNTCENWFHSMLYVTNFLHKEEMCLGHMWYLSLDMQLFLLSPLVLYPLWRYPQIGKCLVFFFTFLGTVTSVAVSYFYKLRLDIVPDIGEVGTRLYYPTHTRFTPWILGIGLGYALHATKRVSPRLARWTVTLGWVLSVTLMLTSFFLINIFLQPDYQYDRLTSSLYLGLMRPAWALGLAWVVFALSRGYGARGVLDIFSHRIFEVLSRLSLSVYLIHIPVLYGFYAIIKTPMHLNAATLIPKLCSDFSASLVCGCICHLIVEAPPIYINRIMFGKQKKAKTKEQ